MFTNWLTSDNTTKIQRDYQQQQAPPDLIIEVGPSPFTRFPAHSSILSSQSGYFRAAIFRLSENGGKLNENVIFLPNISVEHFTPLLTYMYTGYLELNFENIFGVLLATHLLHMPRALEICRDFLAQTQQRHHSEYFPLPAHPLQANNTSKIIRPIASKASNYGLNFVSPPKASTSNLLLPSVGTKFKSCLSGEQEAAAVKMVIIDDKKVCEEEKEKNVVKKSIKIASSPAVIVSKCTMEASDKVIIDIASCDGPVRFKRVLNDAFEQKKLAAAAPQLNEQLPAQSEVKFHSSVAFHEQMVRNINEQYKKTFQNSEESENSQHSIDIYTCVYCNHTFKSKYCYQKHAKRHINPLNPLGRCRIDTADCESSDGEYKKQQTPKRDSIKPLDMNVQYYPCKYCGCKFPSYYFVHKHRKLCHPEVEAGEGNLSVHNQQDENEKEMEVTSDEKMEN